MAGMRHFDFPIFIQLISTAKKNTFDRIYLNFISMNNLYFLGPNIAKFPVTLIMTTSNMTLMVSLEIQLWNAQDFFMTVAILFISNYRKHKFVILMPRAFADQQDIMFPVCPSVRPSVTLRIS